jgi:hypothetical protein
MATIKTIMQERLELTKYRVQRTADCDVPREDEMHSIIPRNQSVHGRRKGS